MEDWTLAGMLTRKRAANGGKPLSAAQEAEVKVAYDKIAEAQKAYDDYVAKAEAKGNNEALDESHNVEHYQNIVFAFSDLIATHRPLIGDCSTLPYPKKTILYAIEWLMQHYSTMREATTDEALREKYDGIMPTLSFIVTVLARDWHEIDLEDKPAIAELGKFDSFPDWALPLKLKYIDDEKASKEACEAAIQVMEDKVATKNRTATMSVNPSDPEFGKNNTIFTREEYEAAKKRLREHGLFGEQV